MAKERKPNSDFHFDVTWRKQVVDMWRSRGIVCAQVAEGNF